MKTLKLLLPLVLLAAPACGDDEAALGGSDPHRPYSEGTTTVIGGSDDAPVVSGQVTDSGCLQVDEDTCVAVERDGRYCKTDLGPVDAVVVDGNVVQVVCYEDTDASRGETVVVDADRDGDLDLPQQANGGVVVFDPNAPTTSIAGDVTIDANDATLYGNGPDRSVIDGNLIIEGNNARVRGVRVRGDLIIRLNTAAVVFAVVEGNLIVESNNSLVAETDVFGNADIKGNNVTLVNNDVDGNLELSGSGAVCDGNHAFDDDNDDGVVADSERGALLSCR